MSNVGFISSTVLPSGVPPSSRAGPGLIQASPRRKKSVAGTGTSGGGGGF